MQRYTVCRALQNPAPGSHRCCVQPPVQINDRMWIHAGMCTSKCIHAYRYGCMTLESTFRGVHPYLYACIPSDVHLPAYSHILSLICTSSYTSQAQASAQTCMVYGPWCMALCERDLCVQCPEFE